MERFIIQTKDGSPTVSIPGWKVTYHSVYGAQGESEHIFINTGLTYRLGKFPGQPVRILEMGFGTGLNALLTLQYAGREQASIVYTAIEKYPLVTAELALLQYCEHPSLQGFQLLFDKMHAAEWERRVALSSGFSLYKTNTDLADFDARDERYDLVYFDAFAPAAQPELWTQQVFERLFTVTDPGGILVTYCSKSIVRRAMQAAGWKVEKVPGPFGKREIVRAHR